MNKGTISLIGFGAFSLLFLQGCANGPAPGSPSLADQIARADSAYKRLPASLPEYNLALYNLCQELAARPEDFASDLKKLGASISVPNVNLPLHHVEIFKTATAGTEIGIPIVLGYDTGQTPFYPPEGLFLNATLLYDRAAGKPQIQIRTDGNPVILRGLAYRVAFLPAAANDHLKARAKRLAKSGFISMIRPAELKRKPRVYLLDPYDPSKTPLLMVHGLQSTPVAFATLVNALRSNPEIRAKYQIWQFYYASGTPVLANAASLRDSLSDTLHILDPKNRDAAARNIVVIGHSMGGVISHTLVSSSGDELWKSVFRIPPAQLKGDVRTVLELEHILYFSRNPRVSRVIFMAAPHRGSPMADSFVGWVGNALARLPPMQEKGFGEIARQNPGKLLPEAAAFYQAGRFSAVRTLSPRSTALLALSRLPIGVPYHSVMGQNRAGLRDRGSDGVVPYWSSHLDGVRSELIVRSGHGVISNPDAIQEVIRILLDRPRGNRPMALQLPTHTSDEN